MPIQEIESKLEAFTGTMLGDAIEHSNRILLELREREKTLIEKADAEIFAEAERYKKAKIAEMQAKERRRISTRLTENKRKLLEYRESCAVDAFKSARDKIREFTASEDYLPHLKKMLAEALSVFGYGFSAEVMLREDDLRFADELLASTTGVSLAFTKGNFSLGGLCVYCSVQGKQVDMSFDSALGDMVGHFAELTGLQMGE